MELKMDQKGLRRLKMGKKALKQCSFNTFVKFLRYLPNVCHLLGKKLRYLSKLR